MCSETPGRDLDSTMTSQSTNITLPFDYETDTLRAELTAFGEPPGPITKTTKKLYIKKLIKYKRKTTNMPKNQNQKENSEYFIKSCLFKLFLISKLYVSNPLNLLWIPSKTN